MACSVDCKAVVMAGTAFRGLLATCKRAAFRERGKIGKDERTRERGENEMKEKERGNTGSACLDEGGCAILASTNHSQG